MIQGKTEAKITISPEGRPSQICFPFLRSAEIHDLDGSLVLILPAELWVRCQPLIQPNVSGPCLENFQACFHEENYATLEIKPSRQLKASQHSERFVRTEKWLTAIYWLTSVKYSYCFT